jgi:deazaflavin-dependent oxidoreductase (nitroreductase family)
MANEIGARLARVAGTQTLQLTHLGRKTGKPYEVTIWFMVEGDTVYLPTASVERQWPRNVTKRPEVTLRIGDQTFKGRAEPIADSSGRDHVMALVGRKYWYALPLMWLGRMATAAGLTKDRAGAFRVRLN